MLRLAINICDLHGAWTPRRGRWECGASHVQPVDHPALETVVASDGKRTLICVRERTAQTKGTARASGMATLSPPAWQELAGVCRAWPLEHLTVETDSQTRRVAVRAGAWGSLPLYLAWNARNEHLTGSWNFADLGAHLYLTDLDVQQAADLLSHRPRYSHATLFRGVKRLTERSGATCGREGLRMTYPQPAEHALPRELAPGADPVQVLDAVLEHAVMRRPLVAGTAVQLSGGTDSANIAMTLARLLPGRVQAGAILINGAAGRQQAARRRAMIDRLGLADDVTVPALALLPFAPGSTRYSEPLRAGPLEEPYLEAADALAEHMAEHGARTVHTGFGGDEFSTVRRPNPLVRQRGRSAPPWCGPAAVESQGQRDDPPAPSTVAHRSTLMALSATGPLMVRRGLWPVTPFADPHLVRLGEWLPEPWRQGKTLLRRRLAAAGLPPHIVSPRLRENFRHVMGAAVHRHIAPLLSSWSKEGLLIAQCGLIAPDRLIAAAHAASEDPAHAEANPQLYAAATLEHLLRSL